MSVMFLAVIGAYAALTRWQLRQARRFQLRLADRIFAAHEVLAKAAERKAK